MMDWSAVVMKFAVCLAFTVFFMVGWFFKPLAMCIFAASFIACWVKIGAPIFGPSLLILLPILWVGSVKVANFINGSIDAFVQGLGRVTVYVACKTAAAVWYVVTQPLAFLLFAASWYVFPYKCFWTTVVVAPVQYGASVKVAKRIGNLRQPAKDVAIKVGLIAFNVARAAGRNFARAVESRLEGLAGAEAVAVKAKQVKEAVRRRARQITLRGLYTLCAILANAFVIAYVELAIYVVCKQYVVMTNHYDLLSASERVPFLASYMWDNLVFLLKDPTNRQIFGGLAAANVGLFGLFRVAQDNGVVKRATDRLSSMYERIPPVAPTALNLAGSIKNYLENLPAGASRAATASFRCAKNLVLRAAMMVRLVPVYVPVVLIIALACASRPDYVYTLADVPRQAYMAATSLATTAANRATSYDVLVQRAVTDAGIKVSSTLDTVLRATSHYAEQASAFTSAIVNMVATSARANGAAVSSNVTAILESAIGKVSQLAESVATSTMAKSTVQDLGATIGSGFDVAAEFLYKSAAFLHENSVIVIGAAVFLFALAGMRLVVRYVRASRSQRVNTRSKATKPAFGRHRRGNKSKKRARRSLVFLFVALSVAAGIACWGQPYGATKLDGVESVLPPIIQPDAQLEAAPTVRLIRPTTTIGEPIPIYEWAKNTTPLDYSEDVPPPTTAFLKPLDFSQVAIESVLEALQDGDPSADSGLATSAQIHPPSGYFQGCFQRLVVTAFDAPTQIVNLVLERSPSSVRSALRRFLPARTEPLTNADQGRGPSTEPAVHQLEQAPSAKKMGVVGAGCSCAADLARSVPYQRMLASIQSSLSAIKSYVKDSLTEATHAVVDRSPSSVRPALQRYLPARTEPLANADPGRGPSTESAAVQIGTIDRFGAMMHIDDKYIFVAKAAYSAVSYVVRSTVRLIVDTIVKAVSPAPVPPPATPCQEFANAIQDGIVKVYRAFYPPPPPPPPFRDVCVAKFTAYVSSIAHPRITLAVQWSINTVGPTFNLAPVNLVPPINHGDVGLATPPLQEVAVPESTSTVQNLTSRAKQEGLRVAHTARHWLPVDI